MDSPHHVISPDEARASVGCDDNEKDVASSNSAKPNILSTGIFEYESLAKSLVEVATAFKSLAEVTHQGFSNLLDEVSDAGKDFNDWMCDSGTDLLMELGEEGVDD